MNLQHFYSGPVFLPLAGLAIEVLLKGIIIRRDPGRALASAPPIDAQFQTVERSSRWHPVATPMTSTRAVRLRAATSDGDAIRDDGAVAF